MPLQELKSWANTIRLPSSKTTADVLAASDTHELDSSEDETAHNSPASDMRSKPRLQTESPKEVVRVKAWKVDSWSEAPQVTLDHESSPMNMAQVDGLFQEQTSPERQRNVSSRFSPSPGNFAGILEFAAGLESHRLSTTDAGVYPSSEASPLPDTAPWSSAVGHASTGKSGRVIERLQADIDRLHREKQLLKVKFEESEKAKETLATRNQYLQDRNANFEQSDEANLRQLTRKGRIVEELREELRREKARTERAESEARDAKAREEVAREKQMRAESMAAHRETEYETILAVRNNDNEKYQAALDRMRDSFEELMRQREEDIDKYQKLEVVAESQRETLGMLEEQTRKLNVNFMEYKLQIDDAVKGLREHVGNREGELVRAVEEMTRVAGEMKWVVGVEKVVNGNPRALMVRPDDLVNGDQMDQRSSSRSRVRLRSRSRSREKENGAAVATQPPPPPPTPTSREREKSPKKREALLRSPRKKDKSSK